VFHRDVKPANLMLRNDGTVKLMDFGIAKVREMTGLTQIGHVVGTMQYIAPEILRLGDCRRESDQYSLGVIAFEMLAGKRPFDSNSPEAIAAAVLALPPPSICMAKPLLPQTLDPVFARVLAKDPASRCSSCTQFVQALAHAIASGLDAAGPIGEPRTSTEQKPAKTAVEPLFADSQPYPEPNRSRGGISWTTAAIAFVLLAEGVWLVNLHILNQPDPPPQQQSAPVQAAPEARPDTQAAETRPPASVQPEPVRVNAPPPAARSSAEPPATAAVAVPVVAPDSVRPPSKEEIIAAGRQIVTEMLPCFQGKVTAGCWPKAKPHVSALVSTLAVSRDGRRLEFEQLAKELDADPSSQSMMVKLIVASRRLLDDSGVTDLP
jgi:serine/threonine protein kinase